MGEREGWSWTDSSFSIKSAKAFRVTSKGSKPKSSSGCLEEPKPNAACQSVEDDTGIVSDGRKSGMNLKHISHFHTSETSYYITQRQINTCKICYDLLEH